MEAPRARERERERYITAIMTLVIKVWPRTLAFPKEREREREREADETYRRFPYRRKLRRCTPRRLRAR